MSTKNVTLKEKVNGVLGDTIFPATTTPNVYDSAKSQALSQTLVNTPDYEALGFAKFSTATAYNTGDKVYNDNELYRFIADKTAGEWDVAKVEPWSIEQEIEEVEDAIRSLIPAQASADNQLADKEYVNDKVSTDTATFRGTFNLVTDLELTTEATQGQIATALGTAISGEDKNDYAFVQIPTSDATPTEIARIDRYKYTGLQWAFEYSLNNSGFTAEQWAAINSGITSSLVTAFGNKYDKPSGGIPKTDLAEAVQTSLGKADTAMQPEDVAKLAENLVSWEGEAMSRDYVQTSYVETTGGDISIDSSLPANLKSVVPTTDFFASQLISTGFNLLRRATAVGNGWYFEVPHLIATQQSIGTALQNNGVLFTNSNHANLTPTVYFKALSAGVPTSVTDGVAATYTDKNGRRHYTTSGAGYLIVSGIDRASVCAHIGWSRRYDDYISVADAADAGAVVDMAAGIHALHAYDKMLVIGAVADRIERTGENQITWTRRLDRVQPSWTNTPIEEEGEPTGQYLHEADISAMKAGGAAQFETANIGLTVDGTKVSYTDSNAEATTDNVKYELAAEVTGTAAVSSSFACEDWGLIILKGATGTAEVVLDYAQNVPDNLRTSLPIINDLHHCTGSISQGYGVCVNGTYEKDKTVYIQHFLLLQGGVIHVLFTTPINTTLNTLNVSGTGAKPIRILGQNLPAGVVKAQTYATLAYDGVAWNIVDMFCPDAAFDPAELVVDMGLTSGVKWAARDLDLTKPGGFCDTPFTYDKSFFSWGNIDGHNPKNNSFAGVYNWGSVNAADPWYDGQVYGNTKGNTLAGDIPVGEEFDAARANLGSPWRMPTTAEFAELFAGSIYIDATGTEIPAATTDKRVTVNGIVGLYLQSKTNGNRLFFACSGYGNGTSWNYRGSNGYYWSASFYSARYARRLFFYSGGVYPQNFSDRYNGFAVRPVQ